MPLPADDLDVLLDLTEDDLDSMSDSEIAALESSLLGTLRDPDYPYRSDPVGWARKRGIYVWSKQREILEALREHRRVCVVATHGVGKSFIAGLACTWWGDQHPPDQTRFVTTAPTNRQVKAILWQEINRLHKKADGPGDVSAVQWKIDDTLIGFGSKPADPPAARPGEQIEVTETGAFQGIHERYLLVVIDEGAGVHPALFADSEKLMTGEDCRMLVIGNPDYAGSNFHQVAESERFHTIYISFFDSPAATGEEVPDDVLPKLVSQVWVDDQIETYGEGSSIVQRQVHGNFITDRADGCVPESFIRRASHEIENPEGERVAGIDVGGGGTDATVCRLAIGNHVTDVELVCRKSEPEEIAEDCIAWVMTNQVTYVQVDEIGVGRGLIGDMRREFKRIGYQCAVRGVNVAKKASNRRPSEYECRIIRDELWWEFRLRCQNQEITLDWAIADEAELLRELTEPRWFEQNGLIVIEPKDEIRRRLLRSPDRADAILLAAVRIAGKRRGVAYG